MPLLKLFGLFIFLIVFSETVAQITEPALVQSAIPENPDGKPLSGQSSENITHINSDKLNGHLDSESLEVVLNGHEKSAEKYGTEADFDSEGVSESSRPFDSASVKNYLENLSSDSLSSTDRASYDEGTATKDFTDGFQHKNEINEAATSGSFVTVHGEYANGDENYRFVNDYESSSDETTDQDIFFSSDPGDESDKLFNLDDPSDAVWFKQNDATTVSYKYDSNLLKEIEEIFSKGISEPLSQAPATDIENEWKSITNATTKIGDVKETVLKPSYFDATSLVPAALEEVTSPQLNDSAVESNTDIDTTTVGASSTTNNEEPDVVKNNSVGMDGSISINLSDKNGRPGEKSVEIVRKNNSKPDDNETKDMFNTTEPTILLLSTKSVVAATDNHISKEINNESDVLTNFDKFTSPSEELTTHLPEQIKELTSQRTEMFTDDYDIEAIATMIYPYSLVTTVKNFMLNETSDKAEILNKHNTDEPNVPAKVIEENKEFVEGSIVTNTTEKFRNYETEYSHEQNETDSAESPTVAVTDSLFRPFTTVSKDNTAEANDNRLVTHRNYFKNGETENQENVGYSTYNEFTTQQSLTYFTTTDGHEGNAEQTTEPTETPNEEYDTKTDIRNENSDGNSKNTLSTIEMEYESEEFSENEQIVSTTETDNEKGSFEFYETNISDNNSHFNETEEHGSVESTMLISDNTTTEIDREVTDTTEYSVTPPDESSENISTSPNNINKEEKGDVSVEAIEEIEIFLDEKPVESTTEGYNEETTTIFYETSFSRYNHKQKEERETVENTSVLIEKEIIATTESDNDVKDNSSNGAEVEDDFKEKEQVDIEESTDILIEEENVKSSTYSYSNSETESISTDSNSERSDVSTETSKDNEDFSEANPEEINKTISQIIYTFTENYEDETTINNIYKVADFTEDNEDVEESTSALIQEEKVKYSTYNKTENISAHSYTDRYDVSTELSEDNEDFSNANSEEINEPSVQIIYTFTENYEDETTVNNIYKVPDFTEEIEAISTTDKSNFLKDNSDAENSLYNRSTKKYDEVSSTENVAFNEEAESTLASINQDIIISFGSNSKSYTTEKIILVTEIEGESFGTTEKFVTAQVNEDFIIESPFSSQNINKNGSTTDDHEINETESSSSSEEDTNESAQNTERISENVFVSTNTEDTTKHLDIETTTVFSLQNVKGVHPGIMRNFDKVNNNVTKLIKDTIDTLSTKIEVTPVENGPDIIDISEGYFASTSSSKETTTEPEEENVMISSNEVTANISNRLRTTLLRGRSNNYNQSEQNHKTINLNENKTVETSKEEYVPYIKANVFGNPANVSIKIEIKDDIFYVPSNASFEDYSDRHVLNITWTSSHTWLNNSISLTLKENQGFYTLQDVELRLVNGNSYDIWNRNMTVVQKNSTFGKSDFVVELGHDTRIYFSNLDFLRIVKRDSEKNSNDMASPSAIMVDNKDIGIAAGCIAAALFICAAIYFIISRSRKRAVTTENLTKCDVPV